MGNYNSISQDVQSGANSTAGTVGSLGNLFYSTRNILNPGGTQFAEDQTPGGAYFGTTLSPATTRSASLPGILEGMHLKGSNSFFATPLGFMIIISIVIFAIYFIFERGKK